MNRETLEFKASTRAICDTVLQKIAPVLGTTYLSYAYDIQDKKYVYCSQCKWFDHYSNQGMHKYDPVRLIANEHRIKYIRWDCVSGSKTQNEIMAERDNFCCIHGGFSIVFEENGITDILSVATDLRRYPVYNTLSKRLPLLFRARSLLRGAADLETALHEIDQVEEKLPC